MPALTTGDGFPDVVVTAVASTSPVAADAEDAWRALLDGRSGFRPLDIPVVGEFQSPVRIGGRLLETFDQHLSRAPPQLRRRGVTSCSARPTSRSAAAWRPRSRRYPSRRCASWASCRLTTTTPREPAARSTKHATAWCSAKAARSLLVENERHAKARGAQILARLMGAAITSDSYDVVKPDPTGERAGDAISHAIQLGGLTTADIDHVNAHATGTSFGDPRRRAQSEIRWATPALPSTRRKRRCA